VDRDEVCVAGPVLYEVLQGTRTPQEFETIRTLLRDLPCLPTSSPNWIAAGGMAAGLRRRGFVLPLTDLLLAAAAQEHRCRIWSLDAHFESIPGVRLYRPPKSRRRPFP
jgi:predicted nucleic acid-binding protein